MQFYMENLKMYKKGQKNSPSGERIQTPDFQQFSPVPMIWIFIESLKEIGL